MSKILNISDRLKDKRREQQKEDYREKIETIQRIVQCSSCQFICSMCGCHLNDVDQSCPPAIASAGFNLCENCRTEFEDYLGLSKKGEESDLFWHNKEWVKLWSAWLEYQQAISEFRNSIEFKLLTEEPDE